MIVKKVIHEELGQELEKIGFKFVSGERLFWPYEREKDGIRQEIIRTGGKGVKKKKAGIVLYIIIIVSIAIIVYIRTYNRTYNGAFERTYEEYMAILTDNLDDFEYVARTMQQWDEGSIRFRDPYGRPLDFDDVLIKNYEIESEISNNEDFYKCLHNLYDLDEIRSIEIEEDDIRFYYSKPPQGYTYGVAYQIDGNWVSYLWPNI